MPATSLRSSGSWTRPGSTESSSRPLHRKVWGSPLWTGCAGRPLDYGRRIIVYTVTVVTGVDTPVAPRPDAQRRRPSMKRFLALACLVALRSEEHTSELQSPDHLVCRLLLEKKKK